MELSIIISTYNNGQSLIRTLNSVAAQNADKSVWECVIVNNNSTDDTAKLVAEFVEQHKEINFTVVEEPQQGLSFARNRGIAESKGAFLAFIDDDETINEGFVSAYIDLFRNHSAFIACGALKVRYESARPKWMSYFTEKLIANPINFGRSITTIPRTYNPAGGNMAFNREIFNIYGGFDTELGRKGEELFGGEENDLFDRIRDLGERVCYTPYAVAYHYISDRKLTPEYFDKLCYGVGVSKRICAEKRDAEQELFRDEKKKQRITLLLSLFYILTLQPQKAIWLTRMRKGISKGIFAR